MSRICLLAKLVILTWVSFFSLNGCAYHAGRGERQIPGGYHTVAVPVFKNNTHDAGIEVFFTNAFVRELQRSRIGQIADKDVAQVTVEGVIDRIEYRPGSAALGTGIGSSGLPNGIVLNKVYSVVIFATLKLRRNSDQKILWVNSFSKEQSYSTPQIGFEELNAANALYNHSARYQNVEVIAADLMSEAHDRMTENF